MKSSKESYVTCRAGGAGTVAQAMAGPIFESFQDFSSGYMLMQAGNMCACRLQAKSVSAGDARLM